MTVYLGPERRKGGERRFGPPRYDPPERAIERRLSPDRRQEDLAGVLVGFTATDMLVLRDLWRAHEQRQREREERLDRDGKYAEPPDHHHEED